MSKFQILIFSLLKNNRIMKPPYILLVLVFSVLLFSSNTIPTNHLQTVNPVVGDISFVEKFGYYPNANTDNELRIKTHLEYAENLLRNKDVTHLTPQLQRNRKLMLDLLHDYWTNGIFPKNYDYTDQRKPCFIDKDGTICAVGYLVEQTAGRDIAEQINTKFKYSEVLAMDDEMVDNWIAQSGLTKEECATIQPSYGNPIYYYYNNNYISPTYGITSAVFSGVNITLSAVNMMQIGMGSNGKHVPIIGMISGGFQVAYGAVMLPQDFGISYANNESQKILSCVNIGIGTTTMMLGAWNLIDNNKQQEKLTSWNIYSLPVENNNTAVGFNLTRKF